MKYVTLFVAIATLTSCHKKRCYTCLSSSTSVGVPNGTIPTIFSEKYCKKTARQINAIAAAGTTTKEVYDSSIGRTLTVTSQTICKEDE